MARIQREQGVTDKKNGLGSIEIDGESYATSTFEVGGQRFVTRELSMDEFDDAAEAATQPQKDKDGNPVINNRLNNRLLLAKSIVEPPTTVEKLGKFGNVKYLTILQHFNKLNSLPESNPTSPAGPAGPTSPDGGEPLPTS
jgi:hypothetical protein